MPFCGLSFVSMWRCSAGLVLVSQRLNLPQWRALDYASPTAYVSERFAGALTRLPVEVRRPVVAQLSAAGMSTRAIAPIIGKAQQTVSDDIRASQIQVTGNRSPEHPEAPAPLTDEPGQVVKLTGAYRPICRVRHSSGVVIKTCLPPVITCATRSV